MSMGEVSGTKPSQHQEDCMHKSDPLHGIAGICKTPTYTGKQRNSPTGNVACWHLEGQVGTWRSIYILEEPDIRPGSNGTCSSYCQSILNKFGKDFYFAGRG